MPSSGSACVALLPQNAESGWVVDTSSGLPCSPALTVLTWQRARLRAPSTSGACSRGRWRRSFQSSMGKVNPASPSVVLSRSCDVIPGLLSFSGVDWSRPCEGSVHSLALPRARLVARSRGHLCSTGDGSVLLVVTGCFSQSHSGSGCWREGRETVCLPHYPAPPLCLSSLLSPFAQEIGRKH